MKAFDVAEIDRLMRERRTIYPQDMSPQAVSREVVEAILENGRWAPTHGMTQPWRFKVFMGAARERLSNFLGETYRKHTPSDKFLQRKFDKLTQRPLQCPVVVAICMARQDTGKITELDELLAVACAVQNIHLACTARGLGAFWSTPGIMNDEATKAYLELGGNDRCLGFFYIGHPAIDHPQGQREPLERSVEWK